MRRIGRGWAVNLAVLCAVVVTMIALTPVPAAPTGARLEHGRLVIPATSVQAPVTTVELVGAGSTRWDTEIVYVVPLTDGQVLAFAGRDLFGSHCKIAWNPSEQVFHEVCRGTLFDRHGRIVGGPWPIGMGRFPATVEGTMIVVDVSQPPVPVELR